MTSIRDGRNATHRIGPSSQLTWPKEWKAFIGLHDKKVQGNTGFRHGYIQRPVLPSASHSLSHKFLMVPRLLPGTPGLRPPRFKCCGRECSSLNDNSRNLSASECALASTDHCPERKQCSKWSSLSHVSISDAGEIRTLSARRVVP